MDTDAESRQRLAAKRHRKRKNVSSFAGFKLRFLITGRVKHVASGKAASPPPHSKTLSRPCILTKMSALHQLQAGIDSRALRQTIMLNAPTDGTVLAMNANGGSSAGRKQTR